MLRIYASESRSYSAEEIDFLRAAANLGALALDRAETHEAIAKANELLIQEAQELARLEVSREYPAGRLREVASELLKLAAKRPNLMLLDLLMPRKDGFAVLKELHEEEKWRAYDSMPIVVLSSVREEPARRRYHLETAVQFAADDYVEKPVSPTALLQRVKAALAKTSTARQK